MLSRIYRRIQKPAPTVDTPGQGGQIAQQSGKALLATTYRQNLLKAIWQLTALSEQQFQSLYLTPIERYASWVQLLPASENHHHAYLGGLLDHGLELVAYSLKLRQSHMLPVGSAPEDQSAQADAWSAGIAYGALLHDIGKIAVDLHIETADGKTWHPWHGPLQQPYQFRYRKGRDYRLHEAATGLLHQKILPPEVLDWLSGYPELWRSLLYMLAGTHGQSGILGELILQADRLSTSRSLGGNPERLLETPKTSLQQHLLHGLRYLLEHELKINQPGAAGWLTEDSLWLVSKTVTDQLRAYLLSQGIEGIPTSNTRLFDEMQAHRLLLPTREDKAIWAATVKDEDWQQRFTFIRLQPSLIWENVERPAPFSGTVELEKATSSDEHETKASEPPEALKKTDQQPQPPVKPAAAQAHSQKEAELVHSPADDFMTWLREGAASHKLIINDTQAKIHVVEGQVMLVTPGIFQRYVEEFPQRFAEQGDKDNQWKYLQRQFERLKIHKKCPNGLNIWTCEVAGPRKRSRIKGYLLKDARLVMRLPPHDNPFIKLIGLSRSQWAGN